MAKSKITYFINKEKKTVVAKVTIFTLLGFTIEPKTIRAKAKCSPEDEFDVEKGKQLAKLRLNVKVTEFEHKVIRALERDIIKLSYSASEKLAQKEEQVSKYLKTL